MKLDEKIEIRTREGIVVVDGKTVNKNFALVCYKDNYNFVHKPTGLQCSRNFAKIKKAMEQKDEELERAAKFVVENPETMKDYVNVFKGLKGEKIICDPKLPEQVDAMTIRYKEYCHAKRKNNEICRIYDQWQRAFVKGESEMMNVSVSYWGGSCFDLPFKCSCCVGNGTTEEDGKVYFTNNVYEIEFCLDCVGVAIFKSKESNDFYKYFFAGKTKETYATFIRQGYCKEQIEPEELARLVNKNWADFRNVRVRETKNVYCLKLLRLMKKKLIETLVDFKIIRFSKFYNKYLEFNHPAFEFEREENEK